MGNEEKKYDDWNVVKKQTDEIKDKIKIRAGEIRWCRFGINIGNEILGKGETFRRPVLILKKFSGDVFLGLPLTTKIHNGDWYYPIDFNDTKQSVILNQARLLDKKRLEDKMCEVAEAELLKIKQHYCNLILKP